jgi:uncharacterized protein YutE (UPF0331/DUF86 family)
MIRGAAEEFKLPVERKPPKAIIDLLAQQEFITEAERSAFDEFWKMRNMPVHGDLELTDEQTARVLDLVYRLVRTFA